MRKIELTRKMFIDVPIKETKEVWRRVYGSKGIVWFYSFKQGVWGEEGIGRSKKRYHILWLTKCERRGVNFTSEVLTSLKQTERRYRGYGSRYGSCITNNLFNYLNVKVIITYAPGHSSWVGVLVLKNTMKKNCTFH